MKKLWMFMTCICLFGCSAKTPPKASSVIEHQMTREEAYHNIRQEYRTVFQDVTEQHETDIDTVCEQSRYVKETIFALFGSDGQQYAKKLYCSLYDMNNDGFDEMMIGGRYDYDQQPPVMLFAIFGFNGEDGVLIQYDTGPKPELNINSRGLIVRSDSEAEEMPYELGTLAEDGYTYQKTAVNCCQEIHHVTGDYEANNVSEAQYRQDVYETRDWTWNALDGSETIETHALSTYQREETPSTASYDDVLQEYREMFRAYNQKEVSDQETLMTQSRFVKNNLPYIINSQRLSYVKTDLDENGEEELLIFSEEDGETILLACFLQKEDQVLTLVNLEYGEGRMIINTERRFVYLHGSNGLYYTVSQLQNGTLQEMGKYYSETLGEDESFTEPEHEGYRRVSEETYEKEIEDIFDTLELQML